MLIRLARVCAVIALQIIFCAAFAATASADDKSLIEKTLNTPDWLTVRGSQRTRFEVLNGTGGFSALQRVNDFGDVFTNNGGDGTAGLVSLQTSIFAEARFGKFRLVGEIMDSRSYEPVETAGFFSFSAATNAVEPIQAYVAFDFGNQSSSNVSEILIGRFTMDLGSRRLVARSNFRNTVQSYHGVKAKFSPTGDDHLTLFYALLPERNLNDDNKIEYDKPSLRKHFWGAHYENANLIPGAAVEAYLYGRYGDSNRSFNGLQFTPGARLFRGPQPNAFDFDIEAALQIRNDAYVGRGDQRIGFFSHAELGLTVDSDEKIRVAGLFDVASGPDDKFFVETLEFNDPFFGPILFPSINFTGTAAFDPLFGDFSKDFGPEGLFGILARTNIISPAVRVDYTPSNRFDASLTYRAARQFKPDLLIFSFSNPSPNFTPQKFFSGWGHQVDTTARYWIVPKRLQVELGGAFFTQQGSTGAVALLGFPGLKLGRSNTFYGYSGILANF